jgi:ankyrin repeat protein
LSPFLKAAYNGNILLMIRMLSIYKEECPVDVDVSRLGELTGLWAPTVKNCSVFHIAAENGINPVLRFASEYITGNAVNENDVWGFSPIHLAAENGHIQTIQVLVLECGADINMVDDNGWSALHYACKNDDVLLGKMLVGLGCDLHATTLSGETPFQIAVMHDNNIAMVDFMLSTTPDVNDHVNPDDLTTPLHTAVHSGNESIVYHLISAGMNVNSQSNRSNECYTPIMEAVCGPSAAVYVRIARYLLDAGADVSLRDRKGYTILHHVMRGAPMCPEMMELAWYVIVNYKSELSLSATSRFGMSVFESFIRGILYRVRLKPLLSACPMNITSSEYNMIEYFIRRDAHIVRDWNNLYGSDATAFITTRIHVPNEPVNVRVYRMCILLENTILSICQNINVEQLSVYRWTKTYNGAWDLFRSIAKYLY